MFRPNSFDKSGKIKEGAIQGGLAFSPLAGFSIVLMLLLEVPLPLILILSGGTLLLGIGWGAVSASRIK